MVITAFGLLYFASLVVFYALCLRVLRSRSDGLGDVGATALDLSLLYFGAMWVAASLFYAAAGGGSPQGLWGGALAFLIGLAAYSVRARGCRGALADACAIALPGGLAVAKLGCALDGCCYGRPTDLPWSIVYHRSSFAPIDVPLHPTQYYDAIVLSSAAAAGAVMIRRRPGSGDALLIATLVMCAGRFLTEFTRSVPFPAGGRWLTWSQWIVLAGAMAAAVALFVRPAHDAWRRVMARGGGREVVESRQGSAGSGIAAVIVVTLASVISLLVIAVIAMLRLTMPARPTSPSLPKNENLWRWAALAALPAAGAAVRTLGVHSSTMNSTIRALALAGAGVTGLAAALGWLSRRSRAPEIAADPVLPPPHEIPGSERRRRRRRPDSTAERTTPE